MIFYQKMMSLLEKKCIEKNITYLRVLKPLKMNVSDSKLCMNGLKELVQALKTEELLVYKNVVSVITGSMPHLAVVNEDRTSGQILTSSRQIWSKEKNKFISANLLHVKNVYHPQYSILSSIDAEDVHEFVVTNT